jgi:pyruvate dehydrogenase E2 component (dihydrolipoamide acetyltransferase)
MSQVEVKVPDIGGSTEVEVIEICVKGGDSVTTDQSLIVLESDKATMEIPSPQAGVVGEILLKVGDKVSEGDPILILSDSAADSSAKSVVGGEGGDSSAQPAGKSTEKALSAPVAKKPSSPVERGAPRLQDVVVPDIGGAHDVTVIEVNVKAGDSIGIEAPVIVLESDKATMEIPSPFGGKIAEVLVEVGAKVNEGDVIARLFVEEGSLDVEADKIPAIKEQRNSSEEKTATGKAAAETTAPEMMDAVKTVPSASQALDAGAGATPVLPARPEGARIHAGPAVRKLAREFGVDLALLTGSGLKGRIQKNDVQNFVKQGMQQLKTGAGLSSGSGYGLPVVKLPDFSEFGSIERHQMTKIQRLTAENMVRSWLTVPHVTQFDEADITELELFRKAQQSAAEKRGLKLTPLPFLVKACGYALQVLPQFNVSLDMERNEVIRKRYINIGVAVDTPAGLLVPVARDVMRKGLWELAAELADLAAKAKDKKLKPAEMQGGCFTISSLGNLGGTAFTPIVNTPEVAILGVSKAQWKPVYQEGQFVPRLLLPLSLSYDHRAINGAEAARFAALLCELLGDLRRLLL